MGERSFERFRRRLAEKANDAHAAPVTFVAFGDSVTQGFMEYDTMEYEQVYHQYFRRAVEALYPKTVLNVINAGAAGGTAVQALQRWSRDVLMHQPDLLTIGFGLNDARGGRNGLGAFIETMSFFIRSGRAKTNADVVILLPGMMMKRDNKRVHERDQAVIDSFLQLHDEGHLHAYRMALLKLADEHGVPVVDFYSLWAKLEGQGEDIHHYLANGINHPNRAFHKRMADELYDVVCENEIERFRRN